MRRVRPVLWCLFWLFSAAVTVAAEPGTPASYPWRKILTRGSGEGELGAVRVDRDLAVQGAAQANSAVFTPEGKALPFRFEPVTISVERHFTRALGLAYKPSYSADRTPGVVFDNPSRETVEGVELRTGERDFDKLVRIESSEDGVNFHAIGPDQPVYDYSRVEASRLTVMFPPISPRYLRVRVMDYPEQAQLPGVVVDGGLIPGGEEYARRRIRIERFVPLAGRDARATEVLVEMVAPLEYSRREEGSRTIVEGRFEPEGFRSLRAEITSDQPFARSIEFYGSVDGKKYLYLGRSFCCRFTAGKEGAAVELPIEEKHFPFFRLEVENNGSRPLKEIRLLGGAERRQIVFESREPTLILAYGGESAVVRPECRADGEIVLYEAGPEEPNPAYEAGSVNWTRWILATVVGVMLIVLITLLWQGYQSIVK